MKFQLWRKSCSTAYLTLLAILLFCPGLALHSHASPDPGWPDGHYKLPLKLMVFTGSKNGDVVLLKWTTNTEKNVNHFELEKSKDDQTFTILNKQTARGILQSTESYGAEDFKPYRGYNYYRIKVIGNDGRITYSKIIAVKFKR